jgi:hypothetical protein
MSVTKKLREEKSKQTSGRRFQRNSASAGVADWATVEAETLKSCIVTVALAGGALRLGYTADGGAYAIGVYGDGPEAYTEYVRPSENLDKVLKDLEQTFRAIADER